MKKNMLDRLDNITKKIDEIIVENEILDLIHLNHYMKIA